MADTGVNVPAGVTSFHIWAWVDYGGNSGDSFTHVAYAIWAALPAIAAGDQELVDVDDYDLRNVLRLPLAANRAVLIGRTSANNILIGYPQTVGAMAGCRFQAWSN